MNEIKTKNNLIELIEDYGYEDIIIFSNPDYADAFVGISDDNRAIYNYNLMVDHLINKDGLTEEESIDFVNYNTIRAIPYMGKNAPIIMYPLTLE